MTIADHLQRVYEAIQAAASRGGRGEPVALVAVTKTVPPDRIREAIAAGATIIGENRVQEAMLKRDEVGEGVAWHLIGRLQRNKARHAVRLFDLVHSVDSLPLAEALEAAALKADKVQEVLVEVKISPEETKAGVLPDDLPGFVESLATMPHLRVKGLMGIAPLLDTPERSRPYFRRLRALYDEARGRRSGAGMTHLSMGMSSDFEVAVEEGSTMVRVGTAIFGSRA